MATQMAMKKAAPAPVSAPLKVQQPMKQAAVPLKQSGTPVKSSSSSSSGGGSSFSSGGGGGGGGSSSGGGTGSSNYSGSAGGSFAGGGSVPDPVPVGPVMEDITIPDPLADPTYQRQKAELARAKADFDAQQSLAKAQYDGTVNTNMRQMGWRDSVPKSGLRKMLTGNNDPDPAGWDPTATGTAYGQSFAGNEGDFAGRGLYNSGLYAQAQGDLNNDFNDRRQGVLTDQKNWGDTQDLNRRNFEGQQNSTDLAAQSDAVAAIAARLGVNIDQVSPGRQNVIQREKV